MVCLLTALGLLATGLLCFLALYQIKLTYSIVHPFSLFRQQPRRTDPIVQNVWLSEAPQENAEILETAGPVEGPVSAGYRQGWASLL